MSNFLDVRGEICPYPMMQAVAALKKLPAGESTLEVLTDHAPALSTIPWEAAKLGYEADIEEVGSPEWKITLRKSEAARDAKAVMARMQDQLAKLGVGQE
ncbi:MAG TPA: sulfurtransferase TusA family protein [Chloroflexota bacterium]|nr:sulfurtransferase TusA family protein [Chloroflexota bacterium]